MIKDFKTLTCVDWLKDAALGPWKRHCIQLAKCGQLEKMGEKLICVALENKWMHMTSLFIPCHSVYPAHLFVSWTPQ